MDLSWWLNILRIIDIKQSDIWSELIPRLRTYRDEILLYATLIQSSLKILSKPFVCIYGTFISLTYENVSLWHPYLSVICQQERPHSCHMTRDRASAKHCIPCYETSYSELWQETAFRGMTENNLPAPVTTIFMKCKPESVNHDRSIPCYNLTPFWGQSVFVIQNECIFSKFCSKFDGKCIRLCQNVTWRAQEKDDDQIVAVQQFLW